MQDTCVCSCLRPAGLDLPWRVTCLRCASRIASCSAVLQGQRRHVTRSRQQQLTLLDTKECLTTTFCESTHVHVSCHAVNTFSRRCTSGALWSQQGQLLLPGVCDRTALRLSYSSSRCLSCLRWQMPPGACHAALPLALATATCLMASCVATCPQQLQEGITRS